METRELFWSLGSLEIALFYVVGVIAILCFLYGSWLHFRKYQNSRSTSGHIELRASIVKLFSDLLTHRTLVRRDKLAGIAHAAIFFGFILAAIGTTIIFIDYDFVQPLLGYSFWKGDFYLVFSLVLDLGGAALVIGLIAMIWRRWIIRPAKLNYDRTYSETASVQPAIQYWRWEDHAFLWTLLIISVSGFLIEGLRIYTDQPEWARWSPVGNLVAQLYAAAGLQLDTAGALRVWGWWAHGILALAFTAAIPWYKAKHIISVLGSLLLRDSKPLSRLPNEPEYADNVGVAAISDFNLKDMFDLDACTKCGRCHEACPATTTGYPLSPRDLILDLRTANAKPSSDLIAIESVIDERTLWSCMSCGACQDICPVGIEHPSKIVKMRRNLVDQGKFEPLLQATFTSLSDVGNSFGESPRKRAAWVNELEFAVKDIREEPAKNLWFVGDYASFDPRNQIVSRTFARLLKAASVDFALLHEGEHSAGNDIRRAGEEGLYSMLTEHNLEQMNAAQSFDKILTTDPHSYNTIRNEYPEYQDVVEIEHYSGTLVGLLKGGQLKVTKPLNRRVTFHDPCHLGRLNGGYDAPREVLELIGCEIVEMPRNRDNSFCCGAGGGRIWMADMPGEKPSANRIKEAANLTDIDCFVTCCPKDLNMFEDANKTTDHTGEFTVNDIAELVAEAVELDKLSISDVPSLLEQIIDKSSQIVADSILHRLNAGLGLHSNAPQLDAPNQLTDTTAKSIPSISDKAPAAPIGPQSAPKESNGGTGHGSAHEPADVNPNQEFRVAQKELRKMEWGTLAPVEAAALRTYDLPEKGKHRILVAVKHVGVLDDDFHITDSDFGVLSGSFDYKINEWDESAMELALLLSEKLGECEVVAVTVGDEGSENSLRKALAMGADRGVRIWDDSLVDADPITIARGLAGVAKLEQPDLILCGVQSADLGYGSTGTATAAILGVPHSASVTDCDWDGESRMILKRELEGGTQHCFSLAVPAVLTIQTGANQPRYATMRMIKQAKKKTIELVDGACLDDGSSGFVVNRVYKPVTEKATMLSGGADEVAALIVKKIEEVREG
jgi:Fe-S oxidoreductase/electron transfer flavoprotein alpha/beta subunit